MDTFKKLLHSSEQKVDLILEKMGLPIHKKQIESFEIFEFAIFSVILSLFIIMAAASMTLHFTGIHWLFLIGFGLVGTVLSLPVQKTNWISHIKGKVFSFLPYYSFLQDSYYYRKDCIEKQLLMEENQFSLLEHIDLLIILHENYPYSKATEIKNLKHAKRLFVKSIIENNHSQLMNSFMTIFSIINHFKETNCYQHLMFDDQYKLYKKNSLDHIQNEKSNELEKEVEFEVNHQTSKEQYYKKMKEYL